MPLLVTSSLMHSKWLELTFKSQRAVGVQNNNGLALRGRKQMSELLLVILLDEMCILNYSTIKLHSSGSSIDEYNVVLLHITTRKFNNATSHFSFSCGIDTVVEICRECVKKCLITVKSGRLKL